MRAPQRRRTGVGITGAIAWKPDATPEEDEAGLDLPVGGRFPEFGSEQELAEF